MGLATARTAALDGAEVTIASSRQERIDEALRELPDGCAGTALDVRDEAQVAALFERVGALDHLAFTAGDAFAPRPLADLDLADAHAILDVRFWGAVTVIKGDHRTEAGSVACRATSARTTAAGLPASPAR